MNEPGVALGDDVSQGEDGVVPVVEEETEEEAHVRKQRQKKEAEAAKKALKDKHEKFNAFVSARQKQEPEEQRRFTEEMKRQMEALPPGSLSNPKAMHDFYSGFEAYWHRHETQTFLNACMDLASGWARVGGGSRALG